MAIYLCEKCGSRFNSARFATVELCPRCLLRDDVASHLVFVPGRSVAPPPRRPVREAPPEPDAASAELG